MRSVSVATGYVTSKVTGAVLVGDGDNAFPGDLLVAVADPFAGQNLGSEPGVCMP